MSGSIQNIQNTEMHHQELWAKSLEIIRENINPRSYQTWFLPIKAISGSETKLTLEVPNRFFCEWLDNHYISILNNAVAQVAGKSLYIDYKISEDHQFTTYTNHSDSHERNKTIKIHPVRNFESNLNSIYSFDNFIVGDGNRFAHAAAHAVAKAPGKTNYNPLIIYGGTGLGKTHLIQAIGDYARKIYPHLKVYYTSSESFTSHFISSIQQNNMVEFSNFYRSCDILLIDDIHFFNNKGKTQEEFFHTFNALHQNKKQIVLTSDRPINELDFLEERLVSRFKWGLVADIQPPDLETRIAILQKKCEDNKLEIPGEIIDYLAVNLVRNVRELEGALTRLMAMVLLTHTEPTIDLARSVVAEIGQPLKRKLTIEQIVRITAKSFGIPEESFMKKDRRKQIALARQTAMYLCVELTHHSTVAIGLHFGGRDHATVLHAHKTINKIMEKDKSFERQVLELRKILEYSK
jgi:chromosomal replication initiator protein